MVPAWLGLVKRVLFRYTKNTLSVRGGELNGHNRVLKSDFLFYVQLNVIFADKIGL